MRKIYLACSVVLIAVISFGFSVQAQAQSKIAVVDVQKVMSESKGAKSIQKQLEEQRRIFQEEFSKHERELMEDQKALVEGRADMSPEDFAKKRDQFEGQLLETRKLVQKRQQALEKAAGDAIGALRNEVVKIVAELAEKNGYDIVVTKQNVILAEKEMDITSQVMSKLDKSLKQIELKVKTN